jgi:hypothetical protein
LVYSYAAPLEVAAGSVAQCIFSGFTVWLALCGCVPLGVSAGDRIVVLSPGFKRLLVERGVPQAKVDVIYHWADEAALAAPTGQLPAAFLGPDRFRILFAGNMGKA